MRQLAKGEVVAACAKSSNAQHRKNRPAAQATTHVPDIGSALPPRHSTARESPALATNSLSRTISATTAVQPA